MARVVVTGHAGFIGFHVAKRLLANGATVLGIDAVTDYYDPQLKRDRLALLEGQGGDLISREFSLEDREQVVGEIAEFTPDVIIHLAAQAGVRYSLEAPATYIESNLVGTFHVLEAAKASKPAHLLLASSSSIYGGNPKLPWAETDRADAPISLYAATKKGSEDLAHSYSHLWGIPTTAFRFFTVYGAWGRPDMALFKFVKAALTGESIDVYGNAQMRRDFTYIDDLVDWILRLVAVPPIVGGSVGAQDSLSPVAPFRAVNLGGGSPIELTDFIAAIEASTGVTLEKRLLPMQPGDVVETYADTQLLAALIGKISSTPVTAGVQAFVDWYRGYVR